MNNEIIILNVTRQAKNRQSGTFKSKRLNCEDLNKHECISHEKPKCLGSIEYIGTQTFDKRMDHYISNRPKRLNF